MLSLLKTNSGSNSSNLLIVEYLYLEIFLRSPLKLTLPLLLLKFFIKLFFFGFEVNVICNSGLSSSLVGFSFLNNSLILII